MPLYELRCKNGCGNFEVSRKYNETSEIRCPACKGEAERVWSPVSWSFGWKYDPHADISKNPDMIVKNI